MGDQWHSVLGLGPFSPPEAIRIRRRNIVNGTNLQSVSDVVKKITEETLQSFFNSQYAAILKDAVYAGIVQQREHQSKSDSFHAQSIPLHGKLDDLFYDMTGRQ